MTWILVSIISYFFGAVAALLDKVLLSGRIGHPSVYAFFVSLFSLLTLLFIPFGFQWYGSVPTFGALCRRTEERNISRRSSGRDNHGIDRLVRLLFSDRRGHGSDYDDHLGAILGIRSSGRWRYTDHDRFPVEDGRADLSFGGSRRYLYGGVTPPLEIRVSSI